MSSTRTLHPQWRDEQAGGHYPFADRATLVNDAGDFLPNDLFLDASLYPVGVTTGLRLAGVIVEQSRILLVLGDDSNDALCSGELSLQGGQSSVALFDVYGRPAGLLLGTEETLNALQAWDLGTHEFSRAQSEFCDHVCWPSPDVGFRGFVLDDGSVFTGDIWLIGDDGIVLTPQTKTSNQPGCFDVSEGSYDVIRVDVVGDPLFRRRLCGDSFTAQRFIKTIRVQSECEFVNCTPNAQGNFLLSAGVSQASQSVLRINQSEGRIDIAVVGEKIESEANP